MRRGSSLDAPVSVQSPAFAQHRVKLYPDGVVPSNLQIGLQMSPLPPPQAVPVETVTSFFTITLPITHCDGESPAVGVAVTLGTQSTTTDSNGNAIFLDVAAGTYPVTVAAIPGVPGGGSADPNLFVEDEGTGTGGSTFTVGGLPGRPPDINGSYWVAYAGATPGLAAPSPADDRINAILNGDGSWYYAGATRLQMRSSGPSVSWDYFVDVRFKITGSAGDGFGGSLILRGVESTRAMAVRWTAINPASGIEVHYAETGGTLAYTGTDSGAKPTYVYGEVITIRARIMGRKLTAYINGVQMFELTQSTATFDTGGTAAWVFIDGDFAARVLRLAAGAVTTTTPPPTPPAISCNAYSGTVTIP
jgi:hypothetical protein